MSRKIGDCKPGNGAGGWENSRQAAGARRDVNFCPKNSRPAVHNSSCAAINPQTLCYIYAVIRLFPTMLESECLCEQPAENQYVDAAARFSSNYRSSMNKAAETDATETALPNPSAELEALRLQPDEAMTRIYREHRTAFIRWAQGWTRLTEPDLADVFQDCCVALLKNIRTGRLTVLTASVRTYLFGIGKNLLNERLRATARTSFPGEERLRLPDDFDLGAEHRMLLNEEEKRLQNALARLGEPCHRLLCLTFYEGMRSAEIAAAMGYASDEVVRTQRKRCLDKLKNLFKRG